MSRLHVSPNNFGVFSFACSLVEETLIGAFCSLHFWGLGDRKTICGLLKISEVNKLKKISLLEIQEVSKSKQKYQYIN